LAGYGGAQALLTGAAAGLPCSRCPPCRWWGFCSMRSWLAACRRRVAPLHGAIPPIGGGVAAVRGGVTPTLQTTSVKNADNGLLVAKWFAFWAHQCLAWCVGRTWTRYREC